MDDPADNLEFKVSEPSDNAQVVYSARQMLKQMGFDKICQYLIATAVSELSTNIIRYGEKGRITMKRIRNGTKTGFEVTARDHGPGMTDIQAALEENYSTGKGLGLGLSSVRRIMDEFDIWSAPGQGTRIIAKKWIA